METLAEQIATGAKVIIKGITYTVAERYITARGEVAIRLADQAEGWHAGDTITVPMGTTIHTF
jgi:hypothetical protein